MLLTVILRMNAMVAFYISQRSLRPPAKHHTYSPYLVDGTAKEGNQFWRPSRCVWLAASEGQSLISITNSSQSHFQPHSCSFSK